MPDDPYQQWASLPAATLTNVGSTVEPTMPFRATIDALTKFRNAYNGGTPVTTNDLTAAVFGEPQILAIRGARQMIDALRGKPKQEYGHMEVTDPYNPLQPQGGA